MRAAIITSSTSETDGWGRYSLGVMRGLVKAGVKCTVFTQEGQPCPDDIDCLAILRSAQGGKRTPWTLLQDIITLRKHLKGFDIVHTCTEPEILLGYFSGKPYITSTHGTFALHYLKHKTRPLLRWLGKKAFNNASSVIVTSRFTRDLIDPYVRLKHEVFLHNGVNTNIFKVLPGKTRNPHMVMTVGGMKPRKGQDTGVEVAIMLAKKYPDLRYVLVGDMSRTGFVQTLKDRVREAGIEKNVEFMSGITDGEMVALYNETAVYMQPSSLNAEGEFEGYPLTLLEASACGAPIIGTDATAAPDLIKNNDNGFWVHYGSIEPMLEKVEYMFDNPEEAKRMGARAREVAESMSWENNALKVKELYEHVLSSKGA